MKKPEVQPTCLFTDCQYPFVKQPTTAANTAPSTAASTPVPNIVFEDDYISSLTAIAIKQIEFAKESSLNTNNTTSTKAFSVESSSDDDCAMDLCLEFELPSEKNKIEKPKKTSSRRKPSNFVLGVKSAFKKLLKV